jgi:hypothetical protein
MSDLSAQRANKPDAANPAMTLQQHIGSQWRGVADLGRLSGEQDYTKWRASVSIRYEHETSLEGRCAVIRSPDPVPSFHPCHQSGEDQNPGATHRFCECSPSRGHEYDFEQHRCPTG